MKPWHFWDPVPFDRWQAVIGRVPYQSEGPDVWPHQSPQRTARWYRVLDGMLIAERPYPRKRRRAVRWLWENVKPWWDLQCAARAWLRDRTRTVVRFEPGQVLSCYRPVGGRPVVGYDVVTLPRTKHSLFALDGGQRDTSWYRL